MKSQSLILLLAAALLALPSCRQKRATPKPDPMLQAYGAEQDWKNPDHLIPLNYQQAQGKRIFYEKCVWCHADSTPAGPSNRMNLSPMPPLINDGAVFNPLTDEYLRNVVTLGGSAMGKSAIMPPWGRTLTPDEIRAVIAFIRPVSDPPYHPPGPGYAKE